jgi:hypothetical protein
VQSTEWVNEAMTLRDVFEVLSGDLDTCFAPLERSLESPDEDGNYSFEATAARNYVNVAFASIAGLASCMRQWAIARLRRDNAGDAVEEWADELIDGREMAPLEQAVRLGFGLLDRACNFESQWNTNEQWWSSFRTAIQIKYRLTSPTCAADLDISSGELMTVIDAEAGFRLRLAVYVEEPAATPQFQLAGGE